MSKRSLHYLYRRVRQTAWLRSSATQIRVGSSSSFFAVQSLIGTIWVRAVPA